MGAEEETSGQELSSQPAPCSEIVRGSGGWCLWWHVERIRAQQGGSLQSAELCRPYFLAVEGSERGIRAVERKFGEERGRLGLGTSDVDGHESLAGAGSTGGRRDWVRVGRCQEVLQQMGAKR